MGRYYPGEKRVVDRMRALRKGGLGFDRLAARLNTEDFRTRKGTAWHGFAVEQDSVAGRTAAHGGQGLTQRPHFEG